MTATFTSRAAEIEANLARGSAITAEIRANLALAEGLLDRMIPDPWPWQRPGNTRLRRQVRELITANRRLQAENQHLINMNTLLLLQNALERPS